MQTYVKKLNIKQYIYPTTTSCKTANNGQLHISGMIVLPITINNIQLKVNTFIVEDLCTDLLLGGDFCDKHQVNINYGSKHLTINIKQQQITVKFQQHVNDQQVFNIKTIERRHHSTFICKDHSSDNSRTANVCNIYSIIKTIEQTTIAAPHAIIDDQQ